MKRTILLILAATLLVTVACEDRDDKIMGVNIRIKNDANFNFNRVQVGADDKIHENVAPGKYSDYLEYESAYRYAYIKIEGDSTNYVATPIDFVGEDTLNIGFYTYELNVSEDDKVLLNFVVD